MSLLILAAVLAGLVRGFSGFGTAMVFLPLASMVLSPFEALTVLIAMDLIGPLPMMPRALKDGHPADILRLGLGLAIVLPLGLWVLTISDPDIFRWATSGVALFLLICLLSGFRYRGVLHKWMIWVAGGMGGFLTGVAGLPGPPVILLYVASTHPVAVIRANTTVYLLLADIALAIMLWLFGELRWSAVSTGLILIVPYLLANLAGSAIFRPEWERAYRALAYIIIAGSAILGLPVWS